MKTLYLLRHADALPQPPETGGDHERALSPLGIAEALRVAAHMAAQNFQPGLILSSSAVRTEQTAALVARHLAGSGAAPAMKTDRQLYLAAADQLAEAIEAADDSLDSLMVVAHNPGIADLALGLSRGRFCDFRQDYKPATLAVFTLDSAHWHDIGAGPCALADVFAG